MGIVEFKRLYEDSVLPKKAHTTDAGFDLCAHSVWVMREGELIQVPQNSEGKWLLGFGNKLLVKCGFAMALPAGYEAQVRPRSGLALKHGVTVINSPGTIDAGWRAEVGVILGKITTVGGFEFGLGDRVAQMVVQKLTPVEAVEVDTLTPATERGEAGFGSTGQ